MSGILDWLDKQSIGVQSFFTVAFIIVVTTAVLVSLSLIIEFLGGKLFKTKSEEINYTPEKSEALISEYKVHPITRKIVNIIKNDSKLISIKLSFYHIILYYPEKEETIYFYEWDFDTVPAGDFNRGFADAVMEQLGNNYSYEPSMNDTSGIITVVKGE